ncbi:MAG: hypothetical protein KKF50_01880 [Nanoarchaeota archaeon]|nr:hypothetical protein [Nanoarchaeota archaeon]
MNEITEKVDKFYGSINSIKDHRYKSWEHCHNYFKKIKDKDLSENELDLAQLHLAFYLASWGMYRGSSFILQKDYTIYKKIVKIILEGRYILLWDLKSNLKNKEIYKNFLELYEEIEKELIKARRGINEHNDLSEKKRKSFNKEKISEILITKIILGTIGSIPAYDRYFKRGLKLKNETQKFNKERSLAKLIHFYKNNFDEINSLSDKYGYPPMKIIDMYFWVLGEGLKGKEDNK